MDRQSGYAEPEIVGMDLHRCRSVLVRTTGAGERLDRTRIDNSPAALKAEIAKAGPAPRVVLEATYGWYWAADAWPKRARRCTWRIRWESRCSPTGG
ncbi:hypothetical protein ACFWWC_48345 [Streptomyces sp. NPDC058642]|uniref:hypothetical protein n=1 Tax=Streptomyces sp. NPDC058642 TaxID=3346572 RepID=UPI0036473663